MVTMLKNKCSVSKRIKFPTFWYNCYYFTWSDTYFIQLETLLINRPSYISHPARVLRALLILFYTKSTHTVFLTYDTSLRLYRNTQGSSLEQLQLTGCLLDAPALNENRLATCKQPNTNFTYRCFNNETLYYRKIMHIPCNNHVIRVI